MGDARNVSSHLMIGGVSQARAANIVSHPIRVVRHHVPEFDDVNFEANITLFNQLLVGHRPSLVYDVTFD